MLYLIGQLALSDGSQTVGYEGYGKCHIGAVWECNESCRFVYIKDLSMSKYYTNINLRLT